MSNNKDYRMTQCYMVDQNHHTHIAWIPSKHARIGQKVHFSKFMPESTWVIMDTYGTKDYSTLNQEITDRKNYYPSIQDRD